MSEENLGSVESTLQIGQMVLSATTETESGHSLLKCDGSDYTVFDYPKLAAKKGITVTDSAIFTKVGDGLGFAPKRVMKSADGTKILAWNESKLSESSDDGETWTPRTFNLPPGALCPDKAINADKMMTVTRGAENATAHVSDDFGETWTSVVTGAKTNVPDSLWLDIAVSSTGRYARVEGRLATTTSYVAYTSDYGVTWGLTSRAFYDFFPVYGASAFFGNSTNVMNVSSSVGVGSADYSGNMLSYYGSNNAITGIVPGSTITRIKNSNDLYVHAGTKITKWSGPTTGALIAMTPNTTYGSLSVNDNNDILVTGNAGAFIKKANAGWLQVYGADYAMQNIVSAGDISNLSMNKTRIYTSEGAYETDGVAKPYSFAVPDVDMGGYSGGNYADFLYVVGDVK